MLPNYSIFSMQCIFIRTDIKSNNRYLVNFVIFMHNLRFKNTNNCTNVFFNSFKLAFASLFSTFTFLTNSSAVEKVC